MASTAHDSCHRTAQPLPDKPNSDDFESKLDELHDLCKQGGFTSTETHADK